MCAQCACTLHRKNEFTSVFVAQFLTKYGSINSPQSMRAQDIETGNRIFFEGQANILIKVIVFGMVQFPHLIQYSFQFITKKSTFIACGIIEKIIAVNSISLKKG